MWLLGVTALDAASPAAEAVVVVVTTTATVSPFAGTPYRLHEVAA